ncbi:probable ATP-dependent RNA helicase DDX43 [Antedon mediterranea]|uniref:probable ATP-dependent RNA helicase DDX43 n=1 Tax=Antedon mediterranea TaxID=105859 RepID=UPI003AF44EBB
MLDGEENWEEDPVVTQTYHNSNARPRSSPNDAWEGKFSGEKNAEDRWSSDSKMRGFGRGRSNEGNWRRDNDSSSSGFGRGYRQNSDGRNRNGNDQGGWQGGGQQQRQDRRGGRSENEKVIEVDSSMIGKIIGKQGSKIRQLQEESGARIHVSRDSNNYSTPVHVSGSHEAVEKASKLIDEIANPKSIFDADYQETYVPEKRPVINWQEAIKEADIASKERWKDHPPVIKDIYNEPPQVATMSQHEVEEFRRQNNKIQVQDLSEEGDRHIPNPIRTFEEAFGDYDEILDELKKQKFTKPSPIQCQGWPIALKGHDLIGIAQTGSGKTIAFLLPALLHIEVQPVPRVERTGPSVLVLSPTRELAIQIHSEVIKYHYKGIKSVCIYGGGNRREQIGIVKKGVEIVIATPGRLNDLISNGIIDVSSVTFLVLDEADRMLDLGFEPQIMKILLDVRPDRQTMMTSATWPDGVRRLANNYMKDPMQVYVGSLDLAACHSVTQLIEVLDEEDKRSRLLDFFEAMTEVEKVLVFVGRKVTADHLSSDLSLQGIQVQCIHGGREQEDREQALEDFKTGYVKILIATDVASRGIDIKDITYVLNYDCPSHIEEYVHRVGRTGRAGRTGTALTFMTRRDWRWAGDIINIMQEANQEIPDELIEMAERWKRHKEKLDAENAAADGFRRGGRGSGGRGGGGRGRGGGRGSFGGHYQKGW